MTNRLQLDFSLNTNEERVAFLEQYLRQPQFVTRPPTDDELETMGNYVLWGKDPVTGLNAKQTGEVDIDTKHSTWDKTEVESLDGLMEQPTFNEATLQPLDSVPIKQKREVFSRKDALAKCPDYLRQTLLDLFAQIDELDLLINYYELAHGQRKNPPREQLLAKFTEEQQQEFQQTITSWNQFKYLKMRHRLVELRREQYTLRDSFVTKILSQECGGPIVVMTDPDIDCEIEVLPLGTYNNTPVGGMIFGKQETLVPGYHSEENLKKIMELYWKKTKYAAGPNQHFIDFRDPEHVYQIFHQFFELEDAADVAEFGSGLPFLMRTLEFYVERADLTDLQKEILEMKLKKVRNVDIAFEVNKKWGKSYTPNYISTIFRQRIIPKINEAAAYHEQVVSNLPFEEEFKTCTGCGRTLLRNADNFTRKARSKDGLTSRCKVCEKSARLGKK